MKQLKKDLVKCITGAIYSIRTNGGNHKMTFVLSKFNQCNYDSYELLENCLMRKNMKVLNDMYKALNDFLETL